MKKPRYRISQIYTAGDKKGQKGYYGMWDSNGEILTFVQTGYLTFGTKPLALLNRLRRTFPGGQFDIEEC